MEDQTKNSYVWIKPKALIPLLGKSRGRWSNNETTCSKTTRDEDATSPSKTL